MSVKHPIIAITGSSGAGTTSVMRTFEQIFRREGVTAAFLEGDSFHRYDRAQMKQKMAEEVERGNHDFSHFGPEANLFEELAELFRAYGETGVWRTVYSPEGSHTPDPRRPCRQTTQSAASTPPGGALTPFSLSRRRIPWRADSLRFGRSSLRLSSSAHRPLQPRWQVCSSWLWESCSFAGPAEVAAPRSEW